jgi:hypothetical protein
MTGIGGHALHMVQSWQAVVEVTQLTLVDAPGLNRPRALLTDLLATLGDAVARGHAEREPAAVCDPSLFRPPAGPRRARAASPRPQARGKPRADPLRRRPIHKQFSQGTFERNFAAFGAPRLSSRAGDPRTGRPGCLRVA